MEGHVDALERDGGEAALQFERLRLGLGFVRAAFDDLDEVRFDVFERHFFHQGLDVDFLGFEVVGDAGEGIEGAELQRRRLDLCRLAESGVSGGTYISGADVLHVCDVVVDDFQKPLRLLGNVLNHVLQGLLVEGL